MMKRIMYLLVLLLILVFRLSSQTVADLTVVRLNDNAMINIYDNPITVLETLGFSTEGVKNEDIPSGGLYRGDDNIEITIWRSIDQRTKKKSVSIRKIRIKGDGYFTIRGIGIGDNISKLVEKYPNIKFTAYDAGSIPYPWKYMDNALIPSHLRCYASWNFDNYSRITDPAGGSGLGDIYFLVSEDGIIQNIEILFTISG